MRAYQRERRYLCGRSARAAQYQEVEIYPLPTRDPRSRALDRQHAQAPPFRGTPKAQANHNAKMARKWFHRLAVSNFDRTDTHTTLTYAAEHRPADPDAAWRDFRNWVRHLREKCRAAGVPKPELLAVMEWQDADAETGKKAVAPHFHVLLRCGLSRDEIETCWNRKGVPLGRANTDRLQLDKASLEALANYMMKNPNRKHRYYRSRGIRDPVMPPPRDGRYTRRQVVRLATDSALLHSADYWARKYPGWELNDAEAHYNDYLGWSISLKLRRRQPPKGGGNPCGHCT